MSQQWKDCKDVYPPPEEIALAQQDAGQSKKEKKAGKEVIKQRFPALEKLAAKIFNNILSSFNKPEGLTKNSTRGRTPLVKELMLRRRHCDANETDPFFHQYAKDGKVYLITNNKEHSGIDLSIGAFQEHINQQLHQKNIARTSNDGLRLGCIFLDRQYKDTVSGLMTKKKDRKKSDQTGDPAQHFYDMIVTDKFLNPSYMVLPPCPEYYDAFPEEENMHWDPNHHPIFEHERDGAWLKSTWEEYIRPKYKKALDRWNKETGGGDGTPPSFTTVVGIGGWCGCFARTTRRIFT